MRDPWPSGRPYHRRVVAAAVLALLWAFLLPVSPASAATPVGVLESAEGNTIVGWAHDPDCDYSPPEYYNHPCHIDVAIYVDDVLVATVATGSTRDDVPVSGHAGFSLSYDLSNAVKVQAFAVGVNSSFQPDGNVELQGSPKVLQNGPPEGAFDGFSPDGSSYGGWARDPDAPNVPLQVHVYADGPAGGGGTFMAALSADVGRDDVGAHGFSGQNTVGEGRDLYAYALGVNRAGTPDGRNLLLAGSPRSAPPKTPEGAVDGVDGNFVQGWARDQSRAELPVDVHVYVGGQYYAAAVANQFRGDLEAAGLGGSHGYAVPVLTGTPAGQQVNVYAIGLNRDGVPDERNAELTNSGSFATVAPASAAVAAAKTAGGDGARVDYQAEAATRSGPVTATKNAGYTGTGYVDFQHPTKDYLQWTVAARTAGVYVLQWRYANGDADRPLVLAVNGAVQPRKVSMPALSGWSRWRASSTMVHLRAGTNTVRLTAAGASGADIDKLTVAPVPAAPPAQSRIYQAEAGTRSGAVTASRYAGYTGSGYADYLKATGGWVQVAPRVKTAGTYTLSFRYANGSSDDRALAVAVNGVTRSKKLSAPSTKTWTNWAETSITVALRAGANTVRLTSAGVVGPNLDRLSVVRYQPPRAGSAPRGTTYQAEAAQLSGVAKANTYRGATGAGYVDFVHPAGDWVQWRVTVPAAGRYVVSWRHAQQPAGDRALALDVNGARWGQRIGLPPTGSWTTWRTSGVVLSLRAGANTLRLTATGSGGANIDAMTVTRG